jgi:hypothetical protein
MDPEFELVQCEEHGESEPALICSHLLEVAAQLWCSSEPSAEDPYPDAWCAKCDVEFQRFGEWNEENEDAISIKLVCQGCYRKLRSQARPWADH